MYKFGFHLLNNKFSFRREVARLFQGTCVYDYKTYRAFYSYFMRNTTTIPKRVVYETIFNHFFRISKASFKLSMRINDLVTCAH